MKSMGNITQKWVDVLKPFTGNYLAKFTATELSKMLGVPQQTISRIMNSLFQLKLVEYSQKGKNKSFYLDKSKMSTNSLLVILEETKAINFSLNFHKEILIINKLSVCCDALVLFGSYASGTPKKNSDLDIVLVGKCDKKKIREVVMASPIEIHEQIVSYSEFEKNVRAKTAISKEITNNHILFGDVNKIVKIFLENG